MLDSDSWYIRQLTHQTRKWHVAWAGQPKAVSQFLESAWKNPQKPRSWADITCELVRLALRWHHHLTERLEYWQWPVCQGWWQELEGPIWDPYDWVIACTHRSPQHWTKNFDEVLHHPEVHPGLSAWAWAIWNEKPHVLSFANMTPIEAIDTGLRACEPSVTESSWARAWHEWVSGPKPNEMAGLSSSCYPTSIIRSWEEALASCPEPMVAAILPYHTEQLRFF